MEELERTYLGKYLPDDLTNFPSREILDIYIPTTADHPVLRIRKNGDMYEITKKQPIHENDASHQLETTISLTPEEFAELNKLQGKRVRKIRYYYEKGGQKYEIDVFQDALAGLVLVDVEFDSKSEKDAFEMPEFCLAEVTQEKFLAGGMLCGKSYGDIERQLEKFNYKIQTTTILKIQKS